VRERLRQWLLLSGRNIDPKFEIERLLAALVPGSGVALQAPELGTEIHFDDTLSQAKPVLIVVIMTALQRAVVALDHLL